jgi:serine phosphatase RsbU (regulator of sigma subunit)
MATESPSVPRLQITDDQGRRVVLLSKDLFAIGRRSTSDLPVRNTDVSRDHVSIVRLGSEFLLRDHNSRCGTFVNGQKTTERVLAHGDVIELGRTGAVEIVFLLDEHPTGLRGDPTSRMVDFRKIAALLDGLRAMGSSRVLDDVLALVMDVAIDVTDAERGFIMLANDRGELEYTIGRTRGRRSLSGQAFGASQKIPLEVFRTGRPQIVMDLLDDSLAPDHLATVALGIRHVLCTALSVVRYTDATDAAEVERPIGVLYLDSTEKGTMLSTATQHALEAVATQASAAIESARLYRESVVKRQLERELRLAGEIQQALLPEACQAGSYFEVAAASMPCRAIGGDFFDYFSLAGGAFGVALGDVAGKGPSAALLTAMIQGILTAQYTLAGSPSALLAQVNDGLIRRSVRSRFATVVYATLAPDGRLTYCNAGHNPPILIQGDCVRRLETGGVILGLFPLAVYEEETVQLRPGDRLVVFSDGVTEAVNGAGEFFEEERLFACIHAAGDCSPAGLLSAVLADVQSFAAGALPPDDITVLVLRYRPD